MPKKVLIALPPMLLDRVDQQAKAEMKTRSELVRDALRKYVGIRQGVDDYSGKTVAPSYPVVPPCGTVLHFKEDLSDPGMPMCGDCACEEETKTATTVTASLPKYRTPAQIIDDANYPVSRLTPAVSGY